MSDDIPNPLDIPPLCKRCDIPIFDGFRHSTIYQCHDAIKAYLKVYQDDLEKRRMQEFEHPTRDELLDQMKNLTVYIESTSQMLANLSKYMQDVLHATLLPHVKRTTNYDPGRDTRRIYAEEGARSPEEREAWRSFDSNKGIVRAILSPDVFDKEEGLVQDQAHQGGNSDSSGPKPARPEQVRPDVPPQEGVSSEDLRLQERQLFPVQPEPKRTLANDNLKESDWH